MAGRSAKEYSAEDIADFRTLIDRTGSWSPATRRTATIVGITGDFPFDVTLPGGTVVPAPGVSWVSVAVTHRRRGVLRALLAEQHRGFVEAGTAVSLLTASEGSIYGRFGYGTATRHRWVEITRRRAVFRADAPDPGGVRLADTDEIRKLAPAIHRAGSRPSPARCPAARPGGTGDAGRPGICAATGPARCSTCCMPTGMPRIGSAAPTTTASAGVKEVVAVTTDAHVALWRTLLALDLVGTVQAAQSPDDPLSDLLIDPRQVRTTGLTDGMWARILDVPAVLAARRYEVEIDVLLDVHDPFLGPRWPLPAARRPGRGRVRPGRRTGRERRWSVSNLATLGTLLFGGRRAGTLARAGLIQAADHGGSSDDWTRALLADREPQHGTEF